MGTSISSLVKAWERSSFSGSTDSSSEITASSPICCNQEGICSLSSLEMTKGSLSIDGSSGFPSSGLISSSHEYSFSLEDTMDGVSICGSSGSLDWSGASDRSQSGISVGAISSGLSISVPISEMPFSSLNSWIPSDSICFSCWRNTSDVCIDSNGGSTSPIVDSIEGSGVDHSIGISLSFSGISDVLNIDSPSWLSFLDSSWELSNQSGILSSFRI